MQKHVYQNKKYILYTKLHVTGPLYVIQYWVQCSGHPEDKAKNVTSKLKN
jgi:hypothetical protein